MNSYIISVKIPLLLALGCASVGSLSAQTSPFLDANAQEAQAYASGIDQGYTAITSVSDFALMNLSAGPGIRSSYAYNQAENGRDGNNRAFETDITQHSGQLGYVHHFDALAAGINLSYLDSEADSDYRDTNIGEVILDGDGWMLSGGLTHDWEHLTASLIGGAGQLSLDGSRRDDSTLTPENTSSFDTDLYFVTADLHYRIAVSNNFVTAPFVQLKYLNVSMDAFQENTTSGLGEPSNVDSTERDWITGELGLRSQLQVSENLFTSLVLSWEHDFDNDVTEVSGISRGGDPGSLDVPDVGEDRFKAALGLDYNLNDNWTLSTALSAATGDEYDAYGGDIALSYGF